jgi:hypothetical protein
VPFAPNPIGITVAAGGAATATIMKILHNLYKPKFNWEKFEDRKQFIDLVCSFYNSRMELEDLQFFRIKSQEDHNRILAGKTIDQELDAVIADIETNKTKLVQQGMGGPAHDALLNILPQIIKEISPPHFEESVLKENGPDVYLAKARFLKTIPVALATIQNILPLVHIDNQRYPLLEPDKQTKILMDEKLLPSLIGKNPQEITQLLLEPLTNLQVALEDERYS